MECGLTQLRNSRALTKNNTKTTQQVVKTQYFFIFSTNNILVYVPDRCDGGWVIIWAISCECRAAVTNLHLLTVTILLTRVATHSLYSTHTKHCIVFGYPLFEKYLGIPEKYLGKYPQKVAYLFLCICVMHIYTSCIRNHVYQVSFRWLENFESSLRHKRLPTDKPTNSTVW